MSYDISHTDTRQTNINHTYKDSLFRMVFGESKENALSLYNAINGTDYTDVDDLTITTVDDAIYISVKNDVSMLFHDVLSLYEQQSTYNPNMPLRGLEYFAKLYISLIERGKGGRRVLYSSMHKRIPTPQYYVFYNGTAEQPEMTDMKLSDAYDGPGDLEVIAHVININRGHNGSLMKTCRPLADYSEFIHRVRMNKQHEMTDEDAIANAIETCINDGIMIDILSRERSKVMSLFMDGFSKEERDELFKEIGLMEGREQGLKEGRAEGREQGLIEGRAEGRAEGEAQYAALAKFLIEQGRTDDLLRSATDAEYRRQLLEEMDG